MKFPVRKVQKAQKQYLQLKEEMEHRQKNFTEATSLVIKTFGRVWKGINKDGVV